MIWLTWNGRLLDRRFLSELERPAWDSVGTIRNRMTDAVIDEAIRRLPPELATASRAGLRERLIERRNNLNQAAAAFYRLLADEVEIHATDESEIVDIAHAGDRFTDVTIRQRTRGGAPRDRVWFHRRFDANETREVRIYLKKGDDRVVFTGDRRGPTLIRVIGGGGANTFVDSTAHGATGARYYDANPASTAEGTNHHTIDAKRTILRRPVVDGSTHRVTGARAGARHLGSTTRRMSVRSLAAACCSNVMDLDIRHTRTRSLRAPALRRRPAVFARISELTFVARILFCTRPSTRTYRHSISSTTTAREMKRRPVREAYIGSTSGSSSPSRSYTFRSRPTRRSTSAFVRGTRRRR